MKKNIYSLLLVSTVLLIVMTTMISAGGVLRVENITIATPEDGAGMNSATYAYNVTYLISQGAANTANWTLVKIYLRATDTANSSFVLVDLETNGTDRTFTGTINTKHLEDSSIYEFRVVITNGTSTVNKTKTGLILDNDVPDTPINVGPPQGTIEPDGSITFSATVNGSETTGCALMFSGINPGSSSSSMVHSGANCSLSLIGVPEQTYRYFIRATDGRNSTDSAITTFEFDAPSASTRGGVQVQQARVAFALAQDGKLTGKGISLIVGIIIAIFIIWVIFKK